MSLRQLKRIPRSVGVTSKIDAYGNTFKKKKRLRNILKSSK